MFLIWNDETANFSLADLWDDLRPGSNWVLAPCGGGDFYAWLEFFKPMKMKKMSKSFVAGLHLWSVKDQHNDYWITTKLNSFDRATAKGKAYAKRMNSDSRVTAVENHGTIDC